MLTRISVILSLCILSLVGSAVAVAQRGVPSEKIPPSVMAELNQISLLFRESLQADCPSDLCFPKACSYEEHREVKNLESMSLPGLAGVTNENPAPDAPQYFLTRARCEFAYESRMNTEAYGVIRDRLQQKMSRGFLRVTIQGYAMEPLPDALTPEPKKNEAEIPKAPAADDWRQNRDRQLWEAGLKHGPWILGVFLGTLATLFVIWGIRKLGKPSLEEKLLEAEMLAEAKSEKGSDVQQIDPEQVARRSIIELLQQQPEKTDLLVRYWLQEGSFADLAQLLSLNSQTVILPKDALLVVQRQRFQSYLLGQQANEGQSWQVFQTKVEALLARITILMDEEYLLFRQLEALVSSQELSRIAKDSDPAASLYVLSRLGLHTQWQIIQSLDARTSLQLMRAALDHPRVAKQDLESLHTSLQKAMNGLEEFTAWKVAPRRIAGLEIDCSRFLRLAVDHAPSSEDMARMVASLESQDAISGGLRILSLKRILSLPEGQRKDLLLSLEFDELRVWLNLYNPAVQNQLLAELPASLGSRLRVELKKPQELSRRDDLLAAALVKVHEFSLV